MQEETAQPLVRKKVRAEELPEFIRMIRDQGTTVNDMIFVCVGTDRSTGDALGPLVGSLLEEAGYRDVIGTLAHPLDASNLPTRLASLPVNRVVLAVDACLGQPASIGYYQVSNRPLAPGKSVGRRLPPVGTYSIAAIVNADQGQKYALLQSTSLYVVMNMAKEIASAIRQVLPPDYGGRLLP
ncbi:putative sporulation protein YyaC [Paenibacillus sp. UNCCL117]|uniref:spore protease YyaC n=1 Tax=unclassified Paenibacillus TaxID=185978 RepID=UPI00088B4E2C|nr:MULTISPECIES: spore protease YyaC [unclassified Paenibacillus]SDE37242.1 putative sporulation protein YyaC [Paenibacillus sp. cl123]SFW64909.1 putative sporulation protein YyaC [Paenibacillus sp. UNCCL117]